MQIEQLISTLQSKPDSLRFSQVMETIDEHYHYTASAFNNGELSNAQGENQGSCKLFAFAHLHQLTQAETLQLFAEHYLSVLAEPAGQAHQNIRQFSLHGWAAVEFEQFPLRLKA